MLKDIFIDGNGGILGVVARLGLPIVLSVGLVAFLVLRVDTALADSLESTARTEKLMTVASVSMNTFATEQKRVSEVQRNILLQTCINTAKTAEQSNACLRAAELR
jgi:hypothetical protein